MAWVTDKTYSGHQFSSICLVNNKTTVRKNRDKMVSQSTAGFLDVLMLYLILFRFPGLLNCCTVNWVHQWPDDALQFVSNKFLGGLDFGRGAEERRACVRLCQYFHTSTITLSMVVRVV